MPTVTTTPQPTLPTVTTTSTTTPQPTVPLPTVPTANSATTNIANSRSNKLGQNANAVAELVFGMMLHGCLLTASIDAVVAVDVVIIIVFFCCC